MKYKILVDNRITSIKWRTVNVREPHCFFIPKDFGAQSEYARGFKIDGLMPAYNSGVQTKRDGLVISFDKTRVLRVIEDFQKLDVENLRAKYELPPDGRDWQVALAKNDVLSHKSSPSPILYRPLDFRYTAYTGVSKGWMAYPRAGIFSHFISRSNLGLLVRRATPDLPFRYASITNTLISEGVLGIDPNGRESVFPLYLYSDNMGTVERKPNFDPAIYAKICEAVGEPVTPEDVFHYIYAVLHTPEYRTKYKEFLKIDFPRIPYPKNAESFRALAKIGAELVATHLLKSDAVTTDVEKSPIAVYGGNGDNSVGKVKVEGEGEGEQRNVRVLINSAQGFDNVPEVAWNFYIGGYQPAQKWLKDRKGRELSTGDIIHYRQIIHALLETDRLMDELSKLSGMWM